ncbi:hypothetical protein HanOQP8_Chr12g0441511 [Helianthus annuus]|nr:hypothetical protein HanOQP8_Chr12g0441511 [Helianthus annuus]
MYSKLIALFDGGIRRGTNVFKADRSGYTCGSDCGNIFSHVYATGRNMLVQWLVKRFNILQWI